jgi:PilZ domain
MFSAGEAYVLTQAHRPFETPGDLSGRAPERRFHHRALVGAPAWLVTEDARHPGECFDVSMGGAAVRTDAALPVGSRLKLEIALGRLRRPVVIPCEVVRIAKGELGLRFTALDRASLETLTSLL